MKVTARRINAEMASVALATLVPGPAISSAYVRQFEIQATGRVSLCADRVRQRRAVRRAPLRAGHARPSRPGHHRPGHRDGFTLAETSRTPRAGASCRVG